MSYNKIVQENKILKSNHNRVVVQKNKIVNKLNYKIRKLTREVMDQRLVIEQFKKKCEYRNGILDKNNLTY